MTDERIEEVLFEVNGKLAKIDAKLDSLSESILKHEARISKIENDFTKHLVECQKQDGDVDFKTEMLRLLGKGLIISVIIIGSLTGSASIISKFFGI